MVRLETYARSVAPALGATGPASTPDPMQPDVETMIQRLASRLEASPGDAKGWKTLGWSYFHLARFDEAAHALAKAVALDPGAADVKALFDEAQSKARNGRASVDAPVERETGQ